MLGIDKAVGDHLQSSLKTGRTALFGVEEVRRVDTAFPLEPELARSRSVEIRLDDETHVAGEHLSAGADEQMMIGLIHHGFRDERRRTKAFECGHASGLLLRAVHAAGIQQDDASALGRPP